MDEKIYVRVSVCFGPDGKMRPEQVLWDDGRVFSVDRLLDVRPAASLRCGGQGDRYTVRIGGRETYLWFERSEALSGALIGRWFVEPRQPS